MQLSGLGIIQCGAVVVPPDYLASTYLSSELNEILPTLIRSLPTLIPDEALSCCLRVQEISPFKITHLQADVMG